nr:MAG TPA: hypothetical protein [Caudoviricetes sp.]
MVRYCGSTLISSVSILFIVSSLNDSPHYKYLIISYHNT